MQRLTLLGMLAVFTLMVGLISTSWAKDKPGAKAKPGAKPGAKNAKKLADDAVWKMLQGKRTAAIFKKFDADGNDKLERAEFHKILKTLGRKSKAKVPAKKGNRKKKAKANDKEAALDLNAPGQLVFIAAKKKKADAKKKPANLGGLGGSGKDIKKWTELGGPDRTFDKLDKDKDNTLSKKEFVLGKGAAPAKDDQPKDKKKAANKKAKNT